MEPARPLRAFQVGVPSFVLGGRVMAMVTMNLVKKVYKMSRPERKHTEEDAQEGQSVSWAVDAGSIHELEPPSTEVLRELGTRNGSQPGNVTAYQNANGNVAHQHMAAERQVKCLRACREAITIGSSGSASLVGPKKYMRVMCKL
eukprot:1275476-Amphidinium_carterae.1